MTIREERPTEGDCAFCDEWVVDGRKDSGYTGLGTDWMTPDGDYGCDSNPISDPEQGVGSHKTMYDLTGLYLAGEFDYSRGVRA